MNIEQINTVLTKAIVKIQESEIEGIFEARKKSAKKAEMEKILANYYAKRGTVRLPSFDKSKYPPIKGMEGPFRFRDGRILYYDPKEGRYYDRRADMYLPYDDIPESIEYDDNSMSEAKGGYKPPSPAQLMKKSKKKKKGPLSTDSECMRDYRNKDGDFSSMADCVKAFSKCSKASDPDSVCGSIMARQGSKKEESRLSEAKGPKWVKDKDSSHDGLKAVGKLVVAHIDNAGGEFWRWSVSAKHNRYGGRAPTMSGQVETEEQAKAMAMKAAPKLHAKLANWEK